MSRVTPEIQPADAAIQATPQAVRPPRRMVPYVEVPVVRPHHYKHHDAPQARAAHALSPPARASSRTTHVLGDPTSDSDFDGDQLFAAGQDEDETSQADDATSMEDEREPMGMLVDGDSGKSEFEFAIAPPGTYAHLILLAFSRQQLA